MNESMNMLTDLFMGKWTTLVAILVLFFLGKAILSLIVRRAVKFADDGDDTTNTAHEKQAKTLGDFILRIGNIVIYLVVLLMALQLFNVDITPILAGAGVLGVAIGFGAQSLAKDLISGVMIILEHRYSIGDKIKIDNFEGRVVKITMRSTVLRNEEGDTFYIANGSISKVVNLSQTKKTTSN